MPERPPEIALLHSGVLDGTRFTPAVLLVTQQRVLVVCVDFTSDIWTQCVFLLIEEEGKKKNILTPACSFAGTVTSSTSDGFAIVTVHTTGAVAATK